LKSIRELTYKLPKILPDGALYAGQWNDQTHLIEGMGIRVDPNGSIYEGFFKDGKANGYGRYISHNKH
jgi:hypothetical protein